MSVQSATEREMAELLVTALGLEGISPADIDPTAPLFGTESATTAASLGLDSIDALEIALAVQQKYGVKLRSDDADTRQVFSSLRALTAHVQSRR